MGELDLGPTVSVGIVRLEEDIARGQLVARYAVQGTVEGTWRELARGSTVGYRKLDRFEPVLVRKVRLVVEDAVAAYQALTGAEWRAAAPTDPVIRPG